jgi:hypothetical protein
MSFDYLDDLFGKFRKKKTKFSEVEKRAASLLSEYASSAIQKDDFGDQMEQVDIDFLKLTTDEDGTIVFSQDTPLWLNLFLGNKFRRWNQIRKVINKSRNDPNVTSTPEWGKALQVMSAEDKNLMEAVEYCLNEIGK